MSLSNVLNGIDSNFDPTRGGRRASTAGSCTGTRSSASPRTRPTANPRTEKPRP
jgi:hypothetical protein